MYSFLWVVVLILAPSGSTGGSDGEGRGTPKAAAAGLGSVGFRVGGPSVGGAIAGPSIGGTIAGPFVGAATSIGGVAVDGPGASVGFDSATFRKGVLGRAS